MKTIRVKILLKTFFSVALMISTTLLPVRAQKIGNVEIKLAESGTTATIDGKIEADEWRDAERFDLSGGGEVFMKKSGAYFFVGVRGAAKGWGHLYLRDGKRDAVKVFHASAALGMVTYASDKKNLWQPNDAFKWDLRERILTNETRRKMAYYLAENYWLANNNNLSETNEIEFQVKLPNEKTGNLRIAVVYSSGAQTMHYFPANLKDDTLDKNLIGGNDAPDLKFKPKTWAKIVFEKRGR